MKYEFMWCYFYVYCVPSPQNSPNFFIWISNILYLKYKRKFWTVCLVFVSLYTHKDVTEKMPKEVLWTISMLLNEYCGVNDHFQVKGNLFYGSIIIFGAWQEYINDLFLGYLICIKSNRWKCQNAAILLRLFIVKLTSLKRNCGKLLNSITKLVPVTKNKGFRVCQRL